MAGAAEVLGESIEYRSYETVTARGKCLPSDLARAGIGDSSIRLSSL
jgi:hypothetical protein